MLKILGGRREETPESCSYLEVDIGISREMSAIVSSARGREIG